MNHKRQIRKYLRRLIYHPEEANSDRNDAFQGFMNRQIPKEFISEELKTSGRTFLTIEGEEFREFKGICRNLRSDILTEYLKDKEIENKVWYLICDVYFNKKKYNDNKQLNQRIDDFLNETRLPLKNYEVMFPINDLKLDAYPFQIWDTAISWMGEANLENIKIYSKGFIRVEDVKKEFINHTVIKVSIKGTDLGLVNDRARDKAELALKVIKNYLNDSVNIQDRNLLFELSEFSLTLQREYAEEWLPSWRANRKPYGLTVGASLKKHLDIAKKHFQISREFSPNLKSRIERVVYWAGKSIEEKKTHHMNIIRSK